MHICILKYFKVYLKKRVLLNRGEHLNLTGKYIMYDVVALGDLCQLPVVGSFVCYTS